MLVGHYAGAFVARGLEKRLPLAAAFVAVQFVDVWWDLFIMTGVEHARLVPGLPSNPLDLYFMPYTHSLVATFAWAALVFAAIKLTRAFGGSTRVALAAAGAVASHWFLDLLVHRHDLPLAGDSSPKLGLGLWNTPIVALTLELFVLVIAAAFYVQRTKSNVRWVGGFVALLCVVQIGTTYGPLPPTIPAMGASLLAAYVAFSWGAHVVQKRSSTS